MKSKKIICMFLVYLMCLNSVIFIYANQENEFKISDISHENEDINLKTYNSDDVVSQNGFVFDISTGTIVDYLDDYMLSTGAALFIPNEIMGVRVDAIGYRAFYYNYNLTNVVIPEGVTKIGDDAFYGCYNLTDIVIPDSIEYIAGSAFRHCNLNGDFKISKNVSYIGKGAFNNIHINNIIVDKENKYYSDDNGILFNKNKTELIQFPIGKNIDSYKIPNSVTSIGDSAFSYCGNLTNIEIPNSVISIGDYAFFYCNNLTNIEIPNSVTSIGDWAFSYCNNLTNIEISNSVTSIGNSAFIYCTNLTNIEIPNSVTSIEDWTFTDCYKLTNIEIPDSVTSIGSYAFKGCFNLTNIKIPDSVTIIRDYTFSDCVNLTNIEIPDSVTSIEDWAFSYCDNLTNIEIPNSVTSIGNSAFFDCDNLTNIEIPNSVTSIGDWAFSFCANLREVKILNKDIKLPSNAFYYCNNINSVYCYKGSTTDNPSNFPNSNVKFYYLDDEKPSENKKAKLTVSSAECKTGELVDIYVNIKENPGIAVYNLKVNFDKTKLTPVSINQGINGGDKITSNLNEPNVKPETLNHVTALWTNYSNMNYNGYLFKLRFKAKDNIAFTDVPITLECTEEGLLDENYKEVTPEIQNGNITIGTNYDFGDINMGATRC